MMTRFLFHRVLLIVSSVFFCSIQARELRFVQAIWRHGDRAPGKLPYPNDQYNEDYWPRGWEQLTDLGAEQLEELGNFFRDRYVGKFINETFKTSEIYILSSESDRATASAQAFADGMFHLNQCSSNGGARKAPVPIHTTGTEDEDFLLKPTSTDCPEYDQYFTENASGLLNELATKYADLYTFLANVTGFGPGITTDNVADLSNVKREMAHNLTQPEWFNQTWPQYDGNTTLGIISEIDRQVRLNEFSSVNLHKFRGGFLLGDWLQRAKNVANKSQSNPSKMLLYSSHDGTLLSLLYSLKVADGEQIPYAAAVIMEIYEGDVDSFEVEISYRKNGELLPRIVPGCDQACPIDKFYNILQENAYFSLDKVLKTCKVRKNKSDDKRDNDKKKHDKHKNKKDSSEEDE
uniref:Acid phosphatase n=1 Tax=Panagrolaimus sp. ES5 TaxID=591445 RepID=A0AC34GXS3_9BILA